jgi:hypothetical protein
MLNKNFCKYKVKIYIFVIEFFYMDINFILYLVYNLKDGACRIICYSI